MIQITQDEANALDIIGQQGIALNNQFSQVKAAQRALITLLENKYKAVFDEQTGQFEPKEKAKGGERN